MDRQEEIYNKHRHDPRNGVDSKCSYCGQTMDSFHSRFSDEIFCQTTCELMYREVEFLKNIKEMIRKDMKFNAISAIQERIEELGE